MYGQFDLNEVLEQIKAGAKTEGKDGVLAPLIKQLTQAALEAELESHLSTEIRNRKNGKSSKTMKSSVGGHLSPLYGLMLYATRSKRMENMSLKLSIRSLVLDLMEGKRYRDFTSQRMKEQTSGCKYSLI